MSTLLAVTGFTRRARRAQRRVRTRSDFMIFCSYDSFTIALARKRSQFGNKYELIFFLISLIRTVLYGSAWFGSVWGGFLGGILGGIMGGIARARFSRRESALPHPLNY